jgi:hypothetical protein
MATTTYQGATLTFLNAIGSSYTAYFSISNLVLSGTTIITDPALWGDDGISYIGGNTAGSYLPFGTAGGYLWLEDTSLPNTSELGPNITSVLTDLNGDGGVTFTVGIKSTYAYNLYYQTSSGTRLNAQGITGTNIRSVISGLPVTAPPITYGGDLAAYNIKTTTTTAATLDIGSTLFTYNTIPLGGSTFSGSLNVYKNSVAGSITEPYGPVESVSGELISEQIDNIYTNGSASFGITHGLTFDSALGDFYMIYYPINGDSVNSSANYVAIPPISLPFTVGNVDFTPVSGSTAITVELKDISYNYTRLSVSQQVEIATSEGTTLLDVFSNPNGGLPAVVFTVNDTTSGITASFYSEGLTSRSSFTVPTFIYGDEEFKGNFSTTNITNNGFTINLRNFDYIDGAGHSVFDTNYYPEPPTGRLRITGPRYFFKEVEFFSKNDTYSFIIDSSLPYVSSSGLQYTLSFVTLTDVLPATETYTVAWPGVRVTPERMVGEVLSSLSGTTITANVYGIDYLDIYGNSIFSPVYQPIEVASILLGGNAYSNAGTQYISGGTAGSSGLPAFVSTFNPPTEIPPAGTQLVGSTEGATLTQIDGFDYTVTIGAVYFGVSGPTGFAASTTVVGTKGDPDSGTASTLTGTVLSCSDSGLVINVTEFTTGVSLNTDPWVFTGFYYNQPNQGHTGSFQLLNSANVIVNSVPHVQGVTGITLISGSRAISSPYTIAFNDGTLGRRRVAGLTFSVIEPVGSTYPAEQFVGTLSNVTYTSLTLNNFNYLQYGNSIIYGSSGQTGGYISLYAGPVGSPSAKLFTTPVLENPQASYSFTSSTNLTSNAYLEYSNTANGNNFYGTDYKTIQMSGPPPSGQTGGQPPSGGATYFGPWDGSTGTTGYTLLQGLSAGITANARIGFDYMYTGVASEAIIYTLIAEVDVPIPTDQTITINMPASEMARMLLYQSAWTVEDPATGRVLQGYVSAGVSGSTFPDPPTGVQSIDNNGNILSGPNVALLLGSVLNGVNYDTGTGIQPIPVLSNLDKRFTSQVGTPFRDDAGVTIQAVKNVFDSLIPQLVGSGSTGRTLLSYIPAETIESIQNNGLTITSLTSLLKDIDTITGSSMPYVPALSNIFAESAAYGKTDDTIPVSATAIGATGGRFTVGGAVTSSPIAREWAANDINVYGTNFQAGDSITLYVTYEFSKGRKYVLDPFVVTGLQNNYNFAVGNVASLIIGGRRINLKKFNTDGSVDLGDATSDAGVTVKKVFGIKLLATSNNTIFNTVFRI